VDHRLKFSRWFSDAFYSLMSSSLLQLQMQFLGDRVACLALLLFPFSPPSWFSSCFCPPRVCVCISIISRKVSRGSVVTCFRLCPILNSSGKLWQTIDRDGADIVSVFCGRRRRHHHRRWRFILMTQFNEIY